MIPFTKTSILLVGLFTLAFNVLAQDIHEAAKAGDLPKSGRSSKKSPDLPGPKTPPGERPCIGPAGESIPKSSSTLIERGADVNVQDGRSSTPPPLRVLERPS